MDIEHNGTPQWSAVVQNFTGIMAVVRFHADVCGFVVLWTCDVLLNRMSSGERPTKAMIIIIITLNEFQD